MEIDKVPLKDYPFLSIDKDGNVWKNNRKLKTYERSNSLCVRIKETEKRVKVLMVETFLPESIGKKISYKDNDFRNCSLENLVIEKESAKAVCHKLSCQDVHDIYTRANSGKEKIRLIAEEYNIDVRYVYKIKAKTVRKECWL
jgi:hypothetical protein